MKTEEHKARRIIKEELARLKWTVRDLQTTLKGDRRKSELPNSCGPRQP